jgi:hypothetical protein
MIKSGITALFIGASVFGADVVEAQRPSVAQPASPFVTVVGNWSSVNDGGAAFRIDGAKWSGQTAANEATAAGRTLFREVKPAFVSNATAAGAFPLAVWRDVADFSAGTIQVQFKLVGGESDQTAGIVIGLNDAGEYLFVRYNTKDGNVAIWKFANGVRERVLDAPHNEPLPLNTWHTLKVTVTPTKITGTVNDGQKIEHTITTPITGRIGLWTKRDSITTFRGFQVTP